MAIYKNSNPIVTGGLIFYLDAANRKSYPGSGTVWNDLSGNNYSGSLINGSTYDSVQGGTISFDGTEDYVKIENDTFNYSPGTSGELSLEVWIYPTGPFTTYKDGATLNLGGIFGQAYFDASIGWGLGYVKTTAPFESIGFQVRNQSTIVSSYISNFDLNKWFHIVGSFTRNDYSRIYSNGILSGQTTSTSLNDVSLNCNKNNAAIARIAGPSNFYSGCKISIARLYNRPLSSEEVLQNYNASKTRFGL